jgi:DNA-binding transcriptional MerR regulator
MVNQRSLTIRQLARLAKVSVRTLHHYDQIGLLTPPRQEGNNYRMYDTSALLRLQQILFYKEMGFDLEKIKKILDTPGFDYQAALIEHRINLQRKLGDISQLIETIDLTLEQLKGQRKMETNEYFKGFSDEQQAKYEKEAAEKWRPEIVNESNRRWKSLNKLERDDFFKKGERITLSLRDSMHENPSSDKVQAIVKEWQEYINFFYDCTPEILLGLGHMYVDDPRFCSFYERIDPKLPQYFFEAIKIYCARLGITD